MFSVKMAVALLIICSVVGIGLAVWTSIETSQNKGKTPMRDPQPMQVAE